jgi:hypothetical protein
MMDKSAELSFIQVTATDLESVNLLVTRAEDSAERLYDSGEVEGLDNVMASEDLASYSSAR